MRIGGDGVLLHMYVGPTTTADGSVDTTLTTIQDVLFLSDNNRVYDPNVIELRGHHTPTDTTFNLTQFGIGLESDIIRVIFHYNDMMDSVGRKIIAGDVLEFPSYRDLPIFDDALGINRYYVVQTVLWAAPGYGAKWYPHLWLVNAKLMTASTEFQEIIDQASTGQTAGGVGQGIGVMPEGFTDTADSDGNPGTGSNPSITNSLDLFCSILNLSDQVVAEAQQWAFFDPKFFESANLYIYMDKNNYPVLGSWSFFGGDGAPPNQSTFLPDDLVPSGPLVGCGISFPDGMTDGQYYLRIDYHPERLFQKQGNCYKLIEINILKNWTAYNKVLDTFIDNIHCTCLPDGSVVPQKQAVSSVMKQKVDLYSERRQQTLNNEATRSAIADQNATKDVIGPGSPITGLDSPYPTSTTST
jgi:hypothetical protein